MDFLGNMKKLAASDVKTIVLPEGVEPRVINAAAQVAKEGFSKVVLLGNEKEIADKAKEIGADITGIPVIDPEKSPKFNDYVDTFYEMRKKKGLTREEAAGLMKDVLYYGVMMVEKGDADGMVAGSINSTGNTLRPALQILKTAPGVKYVSSFMVVVVPNCTLGDNGTFVFSDCGLTIDPDADNLAEIAIASAKSYKAVLKSEPRVAMMSYSTYGSGKGDSADKVREAVKLAKERAPELMLDGELQADASLIESVGQLKAPGSKVAGYANCLIFPDLQSANIGYKLVQRLAKAEAYGPILQGIKKPVNDLSRGCSAEDIVGVVAITSVQAQMM
ncbi:MAG: phosphate acetyltransferase [Clostridia bacterium]|nr:phosphate acetyltransferase [Clostridia bacterium]